ncbi:uncharacterized protein DUF4245 [Motilibacter peucedani]|uniref:Uncharacterized protein DUF4245 n=1 Tax=Motilibacter peucedani TaxID=598650 RepID=A0A420XVI5_9ACTN|nr:DUF4245 domain-containing protein [Motilibacter peucedani]RKS80669.1 uncharacterized protein DUF4245 [Motilibacter peucedani]
MSTPLSSTPPTPEPVTDGETVAESHARRGRGSVRDLVLSLLAVLAVVGVIVLASPREGGSPVHEIDYSSALADARRTASFAVVAPEGLPAGWRPTSTRTDRRNGTTHWHIGFVTPKDAYASVEQSDRAPYAFVGEMTERGTTQGVLQIGGTAWVRTFSSLRDHRALWNTTDGQTTVVGGTASWAELEQLTRALRS